MTTIIDTIKQRKSIRTFETNKISNEHLLQLQDYIDDEENLVGPLGRKCRVELIQIKNNVSDKGIKLGTYGFIKNHQGYLVGIIENTKMDLVEFGYIFEKVILFATEIGIGTCWIGGTFNRNSFSKEIGVSDNEFIPCITPIGYAKEKQRLFDKTLRYVTKADNKKSWEELFFYEDFETPFLTQQAPEFEIPLEMVRLGPSASNKQPWRIVFCKTTKQFHFYLNHTPNYNKLGFDMQLIDIGIAMSHFELSCTEVGNQGQWNIANPGVRVPNEHMEYIISWVY
ncbi:nitroreductase [Anaerobacillus alkaliphilus]|uniref:Nitroreductase n=1 Tax=Anaerobacillus alkaliphilus TaxID=1548597 RepID=A0A4Q0VWW3_9BACI|nr:nitroreductase family protein [Anaerobacillus alkaliphilus]RXJ04227.1 nitroreductase [Anaerobacillus alkaliphilus]